MPIRRKTSPPAPASPPPPGPTRWWARPVVALPVLGGLVLAVLVAAGIAASGAATTGASPATGPTTAGSTPAPTPTAEELADPDTATVVASTLAPAVAPAVDADAVLGQASGQDAAATLTLLVVADPAGAATYDRDAFGYRAFDTDHNGCDTRNDILRRDLTETAIKAGTHDCVVLTGTLADPYSGTTLAFERGAATSADVQIDHVVPLSDAWSHGASVWTDDQRHAFGNDPLNLLAVKGALNQQKSDANAAAWLPPNAAYDCAYVARQVAVKYSYGLSVTAAERAAMAGVLSTCPGEPLPAGATPPPAVTSAVEVAAQQAAAAAAAQQAADEQAAADRAAADAAAAAAAAAAKPAPVPAAEPAPAAGGTDPRFGTCKEAISNGYGPYVRGVDPEYDWYRDSDKDGVDCEK